MRGVARPIYEELSSDLVRELYNYDPATGVLTRKIKRGTRWKKGEVAGSLGNNGYYYVSVNSRLYLLHRIVWIYVYGSLPDSDIDHINRNRGDNRIANLRVATRGQNNINSKLQHNNTSGYKGAYYDKRRDCWYAEIWVNNKKRFLGRHTSAESAGMAYKDAARKFFGEFAEPR